MSSLILSSLKFLWTISRLSAGSIKEGNRNWSPCSAFPRSIFFRLRYVIYLTQLVSSYMSVLDRTIAVFVLELALLFVVGKTDLATIQSSRHLVKTFPAYVKPDLTPLRSELVGKIADKKNGSAYLEGWVGGINIQPVLDNFLTELA